MVRLLGYGKGCGGAGVGGWERDGDLWFLEASSGSKGGEPLPKKERRGCGGSSPTNDATILRPQAPFCMNKQDELAPSGASSLKYVKTSNLGLKNGEKKDEFWKIKDLLEFL